MDITFNNEKLAKVFSTENQLVREFGSENARLIMRRMQFLKAASCLEEVPSSRPTRRHQLIGDRKGQFAVDLKHPKRLIFVPNHNPLPLKPDGGIDLHKVSRITVIGVEDYH
jgi:proteic killer suppression protein